MDERKTTANQESQSSSVLDLCWSYDTAARVLQTEASAGIHNEDYSMIITSGSSPPEDTGSPGNIFEDGNQLRHQVSGHSLKSTLRRNSFDSSKSSNLCQSLLECKNPQHATDDNEIRNILDDFYELHFQKACNEREDSGKAVLDKISMKIEELRANQHMYSLRNLQVARIILNRDGPKILQSHSTESVFSSPVHDQSSKYTKTIPGLSEDVIRFIKSSKEK
ncbi:shieldin complex subunit 1 isoform X2 [Bombina bombina]|nr:shieldin complex subunit 1 isoform X2 [Bombina bombina]XP_053568157.1 shieldin complex subunit 1 isoform X2 [Bombina bombina]